MAARTCHNCIYARFDAGEWLHNAFFNLPLAPKCANHPHFPGVLREVPGVPCPNYHPRPPEPEGAVRRIPLDNGQYAIVDAADYESLSRYRWRLHNGYAARQEKNRFISMHQQIMQPPKGMIVDHGNCDRLDCRRSNLRVCTRGQNARNRRKQRGASSRFKGVGYNKQRRKWYAHIRFEGRPTWLGYIEDEVEAARTYDRAAVAYFREFAHLNFPEEWPPERREEVYAQRDAAAKKEGKKVRRKEGKKLRKEEGKKVRKKRGKTDAHSRRKGGSKSRRPKCKQSTRRRKRAKAARPATKARPRPKRTRKRAPPRLRGGLS